MFYSQATLICMEAGFLSENYGGQRKVAFFKYQKKKMCPLTSLFGETILEE